MSARDAAVAAKESVNLIDLIQEHVSLMKDGPAHVGACPFCRSAVPSFRANEEKQLYHCMSCKKGGDAISFYMDLFGLSWAESLVKLSAHSQMAGSRT